VPPDGLQLSQHVQPLVSQIRAGRAAWGCLLVPAAAEALVLLALHHAMPQTPFGFTGELADGNGLPRSG
jgi:hypothetical protein